MGLLLDLLTQGSGAHTIAALTTAFIRPIIIRATFGINYDIPMGMIEGTPQNQRFLYILIMIIIHHLLLYIIIYFSFDSVFIILKNTLFTSFFTFIIVYISLGLFKKGLND
tara:strand:- start:240 stop:572 length:333 start_codon:yes stop_codon:yes gene_type:complete